ncbi:hypothetical protein NIE88_07550 [Sporolactobacillus shoreicorticis]|uniref:Major tropism determinant N-terminal domain-containing protein n=1 Tax=Sporolactobacillus shoreicorticis TaxID=1923877 RepID=A0ABW5S9C5_9BACL|nr:hypothetical protein [Sporolactobacillus shoreicorticis]MCO7125624.1 hypothetical protein [Sporolactobacillus shoreicorticis]
MTYRPIQHYRGNEADLPQLMAGEIGVATDTRKLFFGAGGNQEVARVGYVPLMTTEDMEIHAAPDGSDETGDGTESRPFKTIQKTFDSIPTVNNEHMVSIIVPAAAVFNETRLTLSSKLGGRIEISNGFATSDIDTVSDSDRATINLNDQFLIRNIFSIISMRYLNFNLKTLTDEDRKNVVALSGVFRSDIFSSHVTSEVGEKSVAGVYASSATTLELHNKIRITNANFAVYATGGSTLKLYDFDQGATTDSNIGIGCDSSIVFKGTGYLPTGATAQAKYNGGQIYPS